MVNSTSRRQALTGTVVVVTAMLGVSGCGGAAGATPTRASATPVATRTATVSGVSTPTFVEPPPVRTATATATAVPTASPTITPAASTPPATPVKLLGLTVAPQTLQVGETVSVSARTQGSVHRVVLYMSAGPAGFNASYPLTRNATGAWVAQIAAPPSSGDYHYSLAMFGAHNVSHLADNDTWNIHVGPTATATTVGGSVPSTIPDNLPLSPPFSYGNPIPATFSANGKAYNGAELVSDSRPDIKPGVVSQWYVSRFPRAGWTVDPATIPPPGATSFAIVATSGAQVCLVTYANATIHEFYTVAAG